MCVSDFDDDLCFKNIDLSIEKLNYQGDLLRKNSLIEEGSGNISRQKYCHNEKEILAEKLCMVFVCVPVFCVSAFVYLFDFYV